ncbi:hypothetical protein Dimus_024524 [Dionaea muscipula]
MKKTMKSLHWFFMEATIYYAAHLLTIKSLPLSQTNAVCFTIKKLPDSRLPCHNRFIQESKESLHAKSLLQRFKLPTDKKLTNRGTTKPCASSFTPDSPRLVMEKPPTADHRHMKKKKKSHTRNQEPPIDRQSSTPSLKITNVSHHSPFFQRLAECEVHPSLTSRFFKASSKSRFIVRPLCMKKLLHFP